MRITCSIPDVYLEGAWEDIPEADQKIIEKQHGLPCDGGGMTGEWCLRCKWKCINYPPYAEDEESEGEW
jgi:hypothetical protein